MKTIIFLALLTTNCFADQINLGTADSPQYAPQGHIEGVGTCTGDCNTANNPQN